MDKKRTKFSLSRKRKKSNTDEVANRDVYLLDESSEKIVLSLDEISVESKENRTKTPFTDGKVEPSTQHNNAKKSIATWLTKKCNPKTVSCPMCGKVVILSKINQHLDNNCKSYFGQHSHSSSKATPTCTTDKLPGSNSHRESVEKGTVSVTPQDKTASAKGYKVDVKRPQLRGENSTLLEVSSSETAIILDPDIASVEKKVDEIYRKKGNCDTLNDGCDISCDSIAKQDCSTQLSFAKCGAETKEILTQDSGNLQTKQTDLLSDQSNSPTTEQRNKSLAEENSEDVNKHENKDYEPYYLANFKLVLNNVLSNEDDRKLFNESDNHIIDTFNGMSPEEQKLYIRLFQRKRGWFRCSKLEYPKISSILTPILNSLTEKGKVMNNFLNRIDITIFKAVQLYFVYRVILEVARYMYMYSTCTAQRCMDHKRCFKFGVWKIADFCSSSQCINTCILLVHKVIINNPIFYANFMFLLRFEKSEFHLN